MTYGARRAPRRWENATPVVIEFGPFTGFKGEAVAVGLDRVTVRIILMQRRSILVELDANMLRYDDTLNPMPSSSGRGFSV
jgi:hypothetical protein